MNTPWILTALPLAGCLLLAGCGAVPEPLPDEPSELEPAAPSAEPGIVTLSDAALARTGLNTAAVAEADFAAAVEVNGRVELDEDRTVRVAAFAPGIVRECCESVGSYVREGETLAVLHSHQTHELLAEYRQAQAELAAREAERDYAQEAYRRASRLHEIKAGPLADVQRTEAALARAERAVDAAKAHLAGALAHFEYLGVEPPAGGRDAQAPEHLEIVVKAPRAGTVIDRSTTLGDVVQEGDQLYTVSDVGRVWVIAQVPEEQLAAVSNGMKVAVRVRAYPDRVFAGTVVRIGSELDPDTRLAAVRCSVPNPGGLLKVGMYAEVEMTSGSSRSVLAVPGQAVQTVDGRTVVFKAEGDGRFRITPVDLGEERGELVEVLNGLRAGEDVVVHGSFLLKAESMRGELGEE